MSKSEKYLFFKFSQDDEDFSATKATPFTGNRGKKSLIKTEGSLFYYIIHLLIPTFGLLFVFVEAGRRVGSAQENCSVKGQFV